MAKLNRKTLSLSAICAYFIGLALAYFTNIKIEEKIASVLDEASNLRFNIFTENQKINGDLKSENKPNEDNCFNMEKAKYIQLDSYPFLVHFPHTNRPDFITSGIDSFKLRSLSRIDAGYEAEVYSDDNMATIKIPSSTLWAVRLCEDSCRSFQGGNFPSDPYELIEGVSPCAWEARKENARLIFNAAFAAMQNGNAYIAQNLFSYGLSLDPASSKAGSSLPKRQTKSLA